MYIPLKSCLKHKYNRNPGLNKMKVTDSFIILFKFVSYRMIKHILVILLLSISLYVCPQGWSFEYTAGYGTYKLNDIRSEQNLMLNSYGLKATDCFPGYITHSVAFGFVSGHHYSGSSFSYITTGGRLHRADYSGSYTVDMILNGYRLGAFYRYYYETGFAPLYIYLQLGSGVLFSNLRILEKVNIYSESAEETNNLKGAGIYLEPSIGVNYHLTKWLNLSLGGGYEADFLGTLKFSGQKTQIKANWNGLRLYGGIIFILPTKKGSLNE